MFSQAIDHYVRQNNRYYGPNPGTAWPVSLNLTGLTGTMLLSQEFRNDEKQPQKNK